MLPSKEEQNKFYNELVRLRQLIPISENELTIKYSKWYAEQIIKHCVEVAKVDRNFIDWEDNDIINSYDYISRDEDGDSYGYEVNKQSILNVINEL